MTKKSRLVFRNFMRYSKRMQGSFKVKTYAGTLRYTILDGYASHQNLQSRLLLRETMQSAKPIHQVNCVNANNRPIGDELGEDSERLAVVWIVERRNDYRCIADVEIRVARGETNPVDVQW